MDMTEEQVKTCDNIQTNCRLLYDGYHENVEFDLEVAAHREECKYHARTVVPKHDCDCPTSIEKRKRREKRPGYLDQLLDFQQNKDTDRNPKAERQAPRVKKVKYMPELNGFFARDEIISEVYREVDIAMEQAGRDRTWASAPVNIVLAGLHSQVRQFVTTRPDLARHLDKKVEGWVRMARSTLMITVGDAIFDGVLCGNCGVGGLATPWGNEGVEVRCVGTPNAPSCGHTYPMSEWVRLYESGQGVAP